MKLKRILALTLALILAVGLIPAQALATEPTVETTAATEPPATTSPKETEPSVPATTQQETEQPTESTPETSVPETSVPESSEPETSVPESSVPESSVPETSVPETTVPTDGTENTEKTLYQLLKETDNLKTMVEIVQSNEELLNKMTQKSVLAIEKLNYEALKKLENPTKDEYQYFDTITDYMYAARKSLGMCICGSSLNDHSFFCPLYRSYPDVIPAPKQVSMPKARQKARNAANDNPAIYTNKWVAANEDGKSFTLTMEAYATGTTTTTQYIKPADMVIVVDQSASMLYADHPNQSSGIPNNKNNSLKRADLENNATAKKNASHGLYYMALGDSTLCFLVYKDGRWQYYDTMLKFRSSDQSNYGGVKAGWDSMMETAAPNWSAVNRTSDMTDELWTRFEKNGIYPTRYGSAYWALVNFLETVASTNTAHRISIVGFAGRDESETEVLCGLEYVNTEEGKAKIRAAIDNILCTGVSTHHDAGISKANQIFKDNPVNLALRDRNLIFFSDGEGSYGTDDNMTLTQSSAAKKTYGAKVYSVGTALAPPALMEWLSSNYPDATSTSSLGTKDSSDYYFHASSASGLKDIFAQLSSTVGSTTVDLDKTSFIKDVVTQYFTIPEGVNSVTAYSVDCTGYSNGVPQWSSSKTYMSQDNIVVDGNTVTVNGFHYSDNYVSEGGRQEGTTDVEGNFHGRKLVVEITICTQEDFLGGNHVQTNTVESGIYDKDGNQVEKFPVPDVDVATSATANISADINVYLGSVFAEKTGTDGQKHYGLGVSDLHGVISGGYNNVLLDFTKPAYGLDPAMDDYVTVELDIFQPIDWHLESDINTIRWSEVPVVTMDEVLWDTPYKLRITITPKNADGDCKTVFAEDIGWIHVFYPEITFHDVKSSYYGETAESEQIKAAVEGANQSDITIDWINQSREGAIIYDDAVTMTMPADGKIPEVKFSYSIPVGMSSLPKTDVPVEVLVEQIGYVGQKNAGPVNQYVNFKWDACSPACEQNIAEHHGIAASPEFYIHPNTCRLTITKTGGAGDEPYVFTVLKDGKAYTEISITGNGSHTIYELPVGTYSIQEATDWTWRYDATDYDPDSVALSRTNDKGAITCNNTLKNIYWLNDFSEVYRNVFGIPKT